MESMFVSQMSVLKNIYFDSNTKREEKGEIKKCLWKNCFQLKIENKRGKNRESEKEEKRN